MIRRGRWRVGVRRSGVETGLGAALFGLGAGADLSLALLVSGPERVVALVGFQGAIIGGLVLVVLGIRSRGKEALAADAARRTQEMAAHHKDLADYAHDMQLRLGQTQTPWRTTPVYYQFQEHFPDLTGPVNAWLKMVRGQQSAYFRATPQWQQLRAQGEMGVQAVSTGHIRGSCSRCREIEEG